MEMGTSQPFTVATIEGPGKLSRDKIVKIRFNTIELTVLDDIGKKLGFAERATTFRWLIEAFPDLQKATLIVQAYQKSRESREQFENLMQHVKQP